VQRRQAALNQFGGSSGRTFALTLLVILLPSLRWKADQIDRGKSGQPSAMRMTAGSSGIDDPAEGSTGRASSDAKHCAAAPGRRCPDAAAPEGSSGNSMSSNNLQSRGGGNRTRLRFGATIDSAFDCEMCQQCRAAYALHFECFKGHFLASLDADLQRVISAWKSLDDESRWAIMNSLDSFCPSERNRSFEREES
jgi:hypothetical protein